MHVHKCASIKHVKRQNCYIIGTVARTPSSCGLLNLSTAPRLDKTVDQHSCASCCLKAPDFSSRSAKWGMALWRDCTRETIMTFIIAQFWKYCTCITCILSPVYTTPNPDSNPGLKASCKRGYSLYSRNLLLNMCRAHCLQNLELHGVRVHVFLHSWTAVEAYWAGSWPSFYTIASALCGYSYHWDDCNHVENCSLQS